MEIHNLIHCILFRTGELDFLGWNLAFDKEFLNPLQHCRIPGLKNLTANSSGCYTDFEILSIGEPPDAVGTVPATFKEELIMKKLSLLIAALLLIGGVAFSAEVTPTIAIEGSATVTFGYDLETGGSGFKNENTSKITIRLVPEDSKETGSDGEVTGEVVLKFNAFAENGSLNASIDVDSAKLKLGPTVSINVLGLDKKVDKAATGQGIIENLNIATAAVGPVDETVTHAAAPNDSKGIGINFDLGAADLEVGIGSADLFSANTSHDYNFYVAAGLKAVENLTFELAFNFETLDSSWGIGVKAGYDLGIVPILVGFDYESDKAWQLGAGLALKLGDGSKETLGFNDPKLVEGLSVGFGLDNNSNADLIAAFYDGALIPVVDLAVVFELAGLKDLGLGVRADADLGVIAPFAEFKHVGATEVNSLTIGADIKVINHATFTLQYASTDLDADAGKITFATKVNF